MRLVGVEIITFASDWVNEVPVLDGHLLHYVGAPNRYGIPAFYEIHVWAWRNNPDGDLRGLESARDLREQPLPERRRKGVTRRGDPFPPRSGCSPLRDHRQLDRGCLPRRAPDAVRRLHVALAASRT